MDLYTIFKEIATWISLIMGFYLFYKFYAIGKVIDKRALAMVRQLKTMFGSELVNKRVTGKDLLKTQRKNRALIGKQIKAKTFGLLEDVPDNDVVASVLDRDLMSGLFWLAEKTGGALGGLADLVTGREGEKKKSGFKFE